MKIGKTALYPASRQTNPAASTSKSAVLHLFSKVGQIHYFRVGTPSWGRCKIDLLNTRCELESWEVSVIDHEWHAFRPVIGRMPATVLSSIAEFERDLISERVECE